MSSKVVAKLHKKQEVFEFELLKDDPTVDDIRKAIKSELEHTDLELSDYERHFELYLERPVKKRVEKIDSVETLY